MRRLQRLVVLAITTLAVACSAGPAEEDSAAGSEEAIGASDGALKVVQCNIEDGGRFTNGDTSAVTWDTARRFAEHMGSASLAGTAIIGMQEQAAGEGVTKVLELLAQHTHARWEAKSYEQGIGGHGSGTTIFWRPDLVSPITDFGSVDVATLDNGYVVRFGGMLFQKKGTTRTFGFFNGKLSWDGQAWRGKMITDEARVEQAITLSRWIDQKMAPYPNSSRIVTMDMNGPFRGPTWKKMSEQFWDDESDLPTHNSEWNLALGRRLDYIWFDWDGGPRNTLGFIDGPHRSEHIGSDHRFLWATVQLKKN